MPCDSLMTALQCTDLKSDSSSNAWEVQMKLTPTVIHLSWWVGTVYSQPEPKPIVVTLLHVYMRFWGNLSLRFLPPQHLSNSVSKPLHCLDFLNLNERKSSQLERSGIMSTFGDNPAVLKTSTLHTWTAEKGLSLLWDMYINMSCNIHYSISCGPLMTPKFLRVQEEVFDSNNLISSDPFKGFSWLPRVNGTSSAVTNLSQCVHWYMVLCISGQTEKD